MAQYENRNEMVAEQKVDPLLFEREMNPHLDILYRSALRLTGNSNDADDLVQDTYLRAFRFFHQYRPGTNARAWMTCIMNTVFLNQYRKAARYGEYIPYEDLQEFYLYDRFADQFSSTSVTDPMEIVMERLNIDIIQRSIQSLPVEFRTTVALATLENFSYQEISEILNIPIGTVRSRLSRGRKLLQKSLWSYLKEGYKEC